MRLNGDELQEVAKVIAGRLNKATGPVSVMIPTRGFSRFGAEDGVWYDPETDRRFISPLKRDILRKMAKDFLKSCVARS